MRIRYSYLMVWADIIGWSVDKWVHFLRAFIPGSPTKMNLSIHPRAKLNTVARPPKEPPGKTLNFEKAAISCHPGDTHFQRLNTHNHQSTSCQIPEVIRAYRDRPDRPKHVLCYSAFQRNNFNGRDIAVNYIVDHVFYFSSGAFLHQGM